MVEVGAPGRLLCRRRWQGRAGGDGGARSKMGGAHKDHAQGHHHEGCGPGVGTCDRVVHRELADGAGPGTGRPLGEHDPPEDHRDPQAGEPEARGRDRLALTVVEPGHGSGSEAERHTDRAAGQDQPDVVALSGNRLQEVAADDDHDRDRQDEC